MADVADQTRHVEEGPETRSLEERKRDRQMIELLNELRVQRSPACSCCSASC